MEGASLNTLLDVGTLPVRADNDARTALLAEVLWGAARGRRNVVLLTLGTGVGGAAMVDGIILHGAAGIAGHFGHMTVDLEVSCAFVETRVPRDTFFVTRHRR
jgi:glucokinase